MRYATPYERALLDDEVDALLQEAEAPLSEIGWTDEARAAALAARRAKAKGRGDRSKGSLSGILGKGFKDQSKRDTLAALAKQERGMARFHKRGLDKRDLADQYALQRKVDAHDLEAKLIQRRQDRLYVRPADRPKTSDPYYTSWWNAKGERDPQTFYSRGEVVRDTADVTDSFFDRAEGGRKHGISARIKTKGKVDPRVKYGSMTAGERTVMNKRLAGQRWRNRRRG